MGQWEEDGVTYTYTQRKDIGIYECFVGSIVSHNEIYIKEAGEHCGRGIDPFRSGMKLQSKGKFSWFYNYFSRAFLNLQEIFQ